MTRIDGMTAPESSKSPTSSENTPEADESRNNDVETLAPIARTETQVHQFWKFKLRPDDDGEPQDWWFASTAIPLIAATSGPLANVMSIAALITTWRVAYDPENPGADDMAVQRIPDPRWCIALNAASLACGFIGNIFLLFNFTRRVRYIVALPATIILWYCATGIVSLQVFCLVGTVLYARLRPNIKLRILERSFLDGRGNPLYKHPEIKHLLSAICV